MTSTTSLSDVANKIVAVTNRGAVSGTISSSGGTYTIPAGYHNGSGKVTGPTYTTTSVYGSVTIKYGTSSTITASDAGVSSITGLSTYTRVIKISPGIIPLFVIVGIGTNNFQYGAWRFKNTKMEVWRGSRTDYTSLCTSYPFTSSNLVMPTASGSTGSTISYIVIGY